MSRRNNKKQQSGLTLIEVLIATVLLSGIIIYAVTTLQGTSRGVRQSHHHIHAQEQANNALENVRAAIAINGTICDAPGPSSSSSHGASFTTTTTLTHVRSTDSSAETFDAFEETTCEEAQAVRVNVIVEWNEGESDTPARHELNSSISLVTLSNPGGGGPGPGGPGGPNPGDPSADPGPGPGGPGAEPGPIADTLTSHPSKVAQGQEVTVTWNEGDILPIPRYTLTHPSSPTGRDEPPTTVSPVTWDGPDPWTGAPDSRSGTITSQDGHELQLTVTRDRHNTLIFEAQRSGEHTLDARNIMGETSQSFEVQTIMKPSFDIHALNAPVLYGSHPMFQVNNFYNGGDEEVTATLESRTPENPFHNEWGSDGISSFSIDPISLDTYPYPPPSTFPAFYRARVDNLYTDEYGHEINVNLHEDIITVQCQAPRVLELITPPSTLYQGYLYEFRVVIDPRNTPDSVVIIEQNNVLLQFEPPVVSSIGDSNINVPQQVEPYTIRFPIATGGAASDVIRVTVNSPMCGSDTLTHNVPLSEPIPDEPEESTSGLAQCTASLSATTTPGRFKVDHTMYPVPQGYEVTSSEEFTIIYAGRSHTVRYPYIMVATGAVGTSPSPIPSTINVSPNADGTWPDASFGFQMHQEFEVTSIGSASEETNVMPVSPNVKVGDKHWFVTCLFAGTAAAPWEPVVFDDDDDGDDDPGAGGGGTPGGGDDDDGDDDPGAGTPPPGGDDGGTPTPDPGDHELDPGTGGGDDGGSSGGGGDDGGSGDDGGGCDPGSAMCLEP